MTIEAKGGGWAVTVLLSLTEALMQMSALSKNKGFLFTSWKEL